MLSARRSAKWIIPQATVALVSLSIRMNPPSARFGLQSVDRIRLEHDLAVGRDLGDADRVQCQRRRREMLERVDVDLILGLLDRRGDHLRAELQPIAAPGQQLVLGHPHDRRLELVGGLGRIAGRGDHVAARAVDFVGEGQGDRLAGDRLVEVAVQR